MWTMSVRSSGLFWCRIHCSDSKPRRGFGVGDNRIKVALAVAVLLFLFLYMWKWLFISFLIIHFISEQKRRNSERQGQGFGVAAQVSLHSFKCLSFLFLGDAVAVLSPTDLLTK